MAGKFAKRPADAVFAAINSQCLSSLEGTSGIEGDFLEKAVSHRFPIGRSVPAQSTECQHNYRAHSGSMTVHFC